MSPFDWVGVGFLLGMVFFLPVGMVVGGGYMHYLHVTNEDFAKKQTGEGE